LRSTEFLILESVKEVSKWARRHEITGIATFPIYFELVLRCPTIWLTLDLTLRTEVI
jgi:hypothetical protein